MARQRLNDQEFVNAWNSSTTREQAAEKAGMKLESSYKRMLEVRKKTGWEFAALPGESRVKTNGTKKQIAKRPIRKAQDLSEQQKDPLVIYSAATFDFAGVIHVLEQTSKQARISVRLTSAKREPLAHVHERFGGILEEKEGTYFNLSWASEEEIHNFLNHIKPHTQRWAEDIDVILQWLESLILFRWHTEEVLRIYRQKQGNGNGETK